MDELESKIRRLALQNAVEHGGKTHQNIVLSRLLGEDPSLRSKIQQIMPLIAAIVSEVNSMPQSQQKSMADEFADLTKPKKQNQQGLPPLEDATYGGVVTRFPPEPNGYPHIGHAKAAIIDEEYARMYGGKMILRFDDTNPEAERLEYYAAIKVGLDWLEVKYDFVKNTSDDIEILYEKCRQMIEGNFAYVCTCKQQTISENRRLGQLCRCSLGHIEQNLQRWEKMFSGFKQGQAIVRYRGDMKSENTVMRDPVLFRIIESKHPLLGDRYRVWPSYDFAVAIEDSLDGVTHAFRTKEYELRNELYYSILDNLKMRKPRVIEFSRLGFEGMPVSKRVLRPLIEGGKVSGYDDPRLPTLEGLKRRGIRPAAIRKFVLSLGFTKADTLAPFETLESFNRKIVDAESVRLHMVKEPHLLHVENLPWQKITIPNHPTVDLGSRTVQLAEQLYIEKQDAENLKEGSMVRLIGLGNINIVKAGSHHTGKFVDQQVRADLARIHWVVKDTACRIKILMPAQRFYGDEFNEKSLQEIDVFSEPHYTELREGAEIQFVRFGYCRKDSALQAIYTHK